MSRYCPFCRRKMDYEPGLQVWDRGHKNLLREAYLCAHCRTLLEFRSISRKVIEHTLSVSSLGVTKRASRYARTILARAGPG